MRAIQENPARAGTAIIVISAFPYIRAMCLDYGYAGFSRSRSQISPRNCENSPHLGARVLRVFEVRLSLPPLLLRNREAPTMSPVELTHRTGMSCVLRILVGALQRLPFSVPFSWKNGNGTRKLAVKVGSSVGSSKTVESVFVAPTHRSKWP